MRVVCACHGVRCRGVRCCYIGFADVADAEVVTTVAKGSGDFGFDVPVFVLANRSGDRQRTDCGRVVPHDSLAAAVVRAASGVSLPPPLWVAYAHQFVTPPSQDGPPSLACAMPRR